MPSRAAVRPRRFLPLLALVGALPAAAAEMPEPEHAETRALIALVNRAAVLWESKGAAACADFKQDGSEWLTGETYVTVNDFDGRTLCHPARPSLEGRDPMEIRDPDGKPVVELFLRQLADGAADGWVHYLWPKRGETLLRWKSTYLRRTKDPAGGEVVVASGAYELPPERLFVVDRVEEAAALLSKEGKAAFPTLRDRAGGFVFYDQYLFVMSWDGVMLLHPALPELEGRNVLDIRDNEGVYPGKTILAALADAESGWVSYHWPRPGDEKPSPKETYVRRIEVGGERWVVASGLYGP